MCIICVDLGKGVMTTAEARRALGEMVVKLDPKHVAEVERTIRDGENAAASTKAAPSPSGQAAKKQP